MSYLKLIKLMYLIDREALLSWGRPLTFDRYVSMGEGPVLSRTYDLIKHAIPPGVQLYWHQFVDPAPDYSVTLSKEPESDEISDATASLIADVFEQHGHKSRWDVVEFTHGLPEWQDPEGSVIPIEYRDILRESDRTDLEIAEFEDEMEALALADRVFG